MRLDLHNHFRELFFAFLARFRVDIVAFPLAVGVGRRVPSFIQVVVTKSFEFYSALFTAHGLPYDPDIEAFTADQILPMVEADLGIGFVPEEFLRDGDGICRIDLKEPIPKRNIVIIKRKRAAA